MHNTKIFEFYHLEMILSDSKDCTNLSTTPSAITPLLQKFSMLFQDPQGLLPCRSNTQRIQLLPNTCSTIKISSLSKM